MPDPSEIKDFWEQHADKIKDDAIYDRALFFVHEAVELGKDPENKSAIADFGRFIQEEYYDNEEFNGDALEGNFKNTRLIADIALQSYGDDFYEKLGKKHINEVAAYLADGDYSKLEKFFSRNNVIEKFEENVAEKLVPVESAPSNTVDVATPN